MEELATKTVGKKYFESALVIQACLPTGFIYEKQIVGNVSEINVSAISVSSGYCGADLKSLCTEAALHALRRRYPQIYASNDKLQLDVSTIEVSAKDFSRAMDGIVPTAQRSASSPGRALRPCIRPLLAHIFQKALDTLMESFPAMQLAEIASLDVPSEYIFLF